MPHALVPGRPRSGRSALLVVASLLGLAGLFLALYLMGDSGDPGAPSADDPWSGVEREVIHQETVSPASDARVIAAGSAMTVTVPGDLLTSPQVLTVAAVTNAPENDLAVAHEALGVFEVSLGSMTRFATPLLLSIPYEPGGWQAALDPEFALVASYWDEGLGTWVEMPSVVDAETQTLIIPTRHLTAIRCDVVLTPGHVYNDYFSIKFDPAELSALQAKYPNFAEVLRDYPEAVLRGLEDARVAYAARDFRDMDKIKAVEWSVVPTTQLGGTRPAWAPGDALWVKAVRYNVYITGDRFDQSWSWKGIFHSDLSRNKYTGNIHVPYDYSGVHCLEVAHEVFHSVQNRYYNLVGMTEFGVPGTTSPGLQFLARLWWLEASAEYAAGKLACPGPDGKPNAAMGGDLDPRRLDLALAHSPSVFRGKSERPAYNNAWFIEYLVSVQGVDFHELFEGVAAMASPSVYDNLKATLAGRGLDIDVVYGDFARWWFFDPRSPFHRGSGSGVPESMLTGKVEKKAGVDLHAWTFEGGAGRHRARLWRVKVGQEPAAGADARRPRNLIVWLDPSRALQQRVDPPRRTLSVTKWPKGAAAPLDSRPLTEKSPVLIETMSSADSLYLLAVRNDDLAGVLGDWTPEVVVSEAALTARAEPAAGSEASPRTVLQATIRHVPQALLPRLRLEWILDGQPLASQGGETFTATPRGAEAALPERTLPPGSHRVECRLLTTEGLLLAAVSFTLEVPAPGSPEADVEVPGAGGERWQRMAVSVSPSAGWRPPVGSLETTKGRYAVPIEGATGVPPGETGGVRWRGAVTFFGRIRSDDPVTVPTGEALAEQKRQKYRRMLAEPRISGGVTSGALAVGPLRGAYAAYRHEQEGRDGWGVSLMWEFVGVVGSGNAQLDVQGNVKVDANSPADDGEARQRFADLVGQAEAVARGLGVSLE